MDKPKPISILLVEDEPAHAELIIRIMRGNHVVNDVVHLTDGRAALDYLFNVGLDEDSTGNPMPGLILLDLKLPKVDGLEVLENIKTNPKLKKIPVVVLTTSERPEDIDAAYRGYANSYITKPVSFEGFHKCIKEIQFYWEVVNHSP